MSFYTYVLANTVFFIAPPAVIFWVHFKKSYMTAFATMILSAALGYILGNLSVWAKWACRRDYVNSLENATMQQHRWATADGGNIIFWLFAGWVPAGIYAVLCWVAIRLVIKTMNKGPMQPSS